MKQIKARYWAGVCYPENMRPGWEDEVGDILQLPGSYCIHDKDHLANYKPKKDADDADRQRKKHVHFILAFGNTTTYSTALQTFLRLSADGKQCINKVEAVNNIRHMYDYLIHDTETCKKQGKYLYDKADRHDFNLFDIGAYEQVSAAEKTDMAQELADVIVDMNFTNFTKFYMYVKSNYDKTYFEVFKTYSGFFERLTRGNYQIKEEDQREEW